MKAVQVVTATAMQTVDVTRKNGRPDPGAIAEVWTAETVEDYFSAYPLDLSTQTLEYELELFGDVVRRVPSPTGRQVAIYSMERRLAEVGINEVRARRMVEAACSKSATVAALTETQRLPRSIDEVLADDSLDGEPVWVVNGYFARGEVTLLAGPPKAGKTTILAHAAAAIAYGSAVLSRATTRCAVLWIDMEQHPRQTKALFKPLGVEGVPLYTVTTRFVTFDLVEYMKENDIGLLVIDSLSKYWDVQDENDAVQVTHAIDELRRIAEETDAAVVVVHHSRKSGGEVGEDVRGSGAITAVVDVAISFKRDHKVETRRLLDTISRHDETPRKLVVELTDGVYRALGQAVDVRNREQTTQLLEAVTATPLTVEELAKESELPEKTVRRLARGLHEQDRIQREGTGRKGDAYKYSFPGTL